MRRLRAWWRSFTHCRAHNAYLRSENAELRAALDLGERTRASLAYEAAKANQENRELRDGWQRADAELAKLRTANAELHTLVETQHREKVVDAERVRVARNVTKLWRRRCERLWAKLDEERHPRRAPETGEQSALRALRVRGTKKVVDAIAATIPASERAARAATESWAVEQLQRAEAESDIDAIVSKIRSGEGDASVTDTFIDD